MASFVRRTPLVGGWPSSRPSMRSLLRASSFVQLLRSWEVSRCLTELDIVVFSTGFILFLQCSAVLTISTYVVVDVVLAFEGKHASFAGALEWIAEFKVPRVVLPSDMSRTGDSSMEKVRSY